MENTKKLTEEIPTGEATVTAGMHRDRDSIDDFEHVDRETSSVEKASKVVSEFEVGRPNQDLEVEYMPKHSIETKVVPESSIATDDSDEWNAASKGLVGSSSLENFLRSEKGFMSSELNEGPALGLDGSSGDMPKPTPEKLIDIAAFSEPLMGGQDLVNTNFITSESTQQPEVEQWVLGRPDDDTFMKTETGLGLPMAEDKLVEGFKTPTFDDNYLEDDTLPPAKSTGLETLTFEDFDPKIIVDDATKIIADVPEPSFERGLPAETVEPTGLPLKQQTVGDPNPSAVKPAEPKKQVDAAVKSAKEVNVDEITEPMELFCKMGLDAWFKPERLHPTVVELVYWRDPKKSGVVFGSVLGILLSLSYFSLISVIAYLSLALLTGTIAYRIYKNIIQAVQKTSDGHPFKEILELDLTLPQDKVREMTDVTVTHLNAAALELRRLFLVEDLVDSIKFGVLLWCLTYLGSWFNGMTIIIIMFVAMFTLPKVYENNKAQIDQNLEIVRAKLAEVSAKVKAAVPIGKKPVVEEKKEQ